MPGGGQNDLWHQLGCRGKYAGEIRIEITYYDTRPKPEKPAVKAKQTGSSEVDGPRPLPRTTVPKRRPLPSDPVTGQVPAQPQPLPPQQQLQQQQQIPEQVQTPPRPQPNPPTAYIPNQSPLQQVEYGTPPQAARYQQQQDHHSPGLPGGGYGSPVQRSELPAQQYQTPERHDRYPGHPDDQAYSSPNYQQPPSFERQNSRPSPDPYVLPRSERSVSPEEDRPPPPPVHRTRNNSGTAQDLGTRSSYDSMAAKGTPPTMRRDVLKNEAHRRSVPVAYPGRPTYKAFDPSPTAPLAIQHSNEERRNQHDNHQPSPPPHYSYDSPGDPNSRAMQPTVEDAPESPDNMMVSSFRRSGSRMPQYEPDFDPAASPAPLNVGTRPRGSSGHASPSAMPGDHRRNTSTSDYYFDTREVNHQSSQAPSDSYNSRGQLLLPYHSELDDTSNSYDPPPVPASLIPGMDPNLALDIAQRINEDRRSDRRTERRYTQSTAISTPPRGRGINGHSSTFAQDNSPGGSYPMPRQDHSRSPNAYTSGPTTPNNVNPRTVSPLPIRDPSPNPHHTIRRKSISPAPPTDGRRLSAVPFGPDDYDALNPTATTPPQESSSSGIDYGEVNGKIITHDGREVDPSDHLPMDTWAPEPEPKKPSGSSRPSPAGPQPMPPSGRRQLRIAGRPQSMAPNSGYMSSDISFSGAPASSAPVSTGRNRLQKKSNRASAMPVMGGAGGSPGGGEHFGSQGSSPLAPLPHHHDNNFTPPRTLVRASTFDYPSENHAPLYGSSPGEGSRGMMRGSYTAPPIPAKVPLAITGPPVMSGALPASRSGGGGYDEWGARSGGGRGELSLMEEMQRIDIGTGRSSRRHGHGY